MNSTVSSHPVPAADELEVSLFGPGFGECVVVHLGRGDWMVVDSCLNDAQDQPVALEYLASLGVDVAKQVRLVVVTHWHDDHIRGSARVYAEAASARFVCSAAFQNKEFFEILAASERIKTVARDSSTSEFQDILGELHRRKERGGGRSQAGPDHWAQDGSPLFQSSGSSQVSVTALSPSPQTITDAAANLGKLIPAISSQFNRFPRCSPNDQSVALLVHSDGCSVLLGADLETVSDPDRGWRAVVSSPVRPQVTSNAIKVAHHGSENGDLDELWSTLLEPNSPAFLTPYSSGRKPLPSDKDVERLKTRTSRLYCTSWPPTRKPPRHPGVDRTLREMTRMHRAVSRQVGHIRLRMNLSQQTAPVIDTFNGACQL